MIKRIKHYDLDPDKKQEYLFTREDFRSYVENWESELLRGISTLAVLAVIDSSDSGKGRYGYDILNELKTQTNNMLILEEGNLYPTLRKLKDAGILETKEDYEGKRKRIFYRLTAYGKLVYSHISGAFSKLVESMSEMIKIDVQLKTEKYIYCPNCSMRYSDSELEKGQQYCSACGFHIAEFVNQLYERGK
ncbi:MAG: helix-turn-helix transcriptional regulator [Candidatus Lokiarchaeota archaeon]|nr:helix-turn-helix transcriptional regulator [Candidatus Lokiarchaeota archaeon]